MTNFETITQLSTAAQWLNEAIGEFSFGTRKKQENCNTIAKCIADIQNVINDLSEPEGLKKQSGSGCCGVFRSKGTPHWFRFCPECGQALKS